MSVMIASDISSARYIWLNPLSSTLYGCLVSGEDFVQGLELLLQLQPPVPMPGIALRPEKPLQLWKPFQEEALGQPVLLEALFIV